DGSSFDLTSPFRRRGDYRRARRGGLRFGGWAGGRTRPGQSVSAGAEGFGLSGERTSIPRLRGRSEGRGNRGCPSRLPPGSDGTLLLGRVRIRRQRERPSTRR